MNSLIDVRDAMLALLIYLDTQQGEEPAVIPKLQDLRKRLGDDCTLLPAYMYAVLTRDGIWDKLGDLWEALYNYSEEMRNNSETGS